METKVWKDQYDAVCYRLANEKETLVTLIKCMANDLLEKEGIEHFIGLSGSEWSLGVCDDENSIVAWADGWHSDLIDLPIDELREIGDSLYWENYEIVKF